MNGQDFYTLWENTYVGSPIAVQFTSNVEDWDGYFDRNMRALLVNIIDTKEGGTFKAVFNVEQYNDHNSQFEQAVYWDDKGNATLTAEQAGMHPMRNNWCEDLYIDKRSTVPFVVLPTKKTIEQALGFFVESHDGFYNTDVHWVVKPGHLAYWTHDSTVYTVAALSKDGVGYAVHTSNGIFMLSPGSVDQLKISRLVEVF